MNNKKSKKGLILLLVLMVVVLMSIGFAGYTRNLNISGNVSVTASSWDVHYNNQDLGNSIPYGIVTTAGSETATNPTIGTNDTNFSFTVTLAEPGDFYEATIYPRNFGTITAYLKSITMSSIADHSDYLSYTVSYDGTPYTATTSNINGVSLAANAQVPVVIRVEYLQPTDPNDLPDTDQTITVSGSLGYSQDA